MTPKLRLPRYIFASVVFFLYQLKAFQMTCILLVKAAFEKPKMTSCSFTFWSQVSNFCWFPCSTVSFFNFIPVTKKTRHFFKKKINHLHTDFSLFVLFLSYFALFWSFVCHKKRCEFVSFLYFYFLDLIFDFNYFSGPRPMVEKNAYFGTFLSHLVYINSDNFVDFIYFKNFVVFLWYFCDFYYNGGDRNDFGKKLANWCM